MSIETQLRAALRDEASTVPGPETDPYARVAAAVGRNRRQRRVIGAGLVAMVAAIAIGVPTVMSRLDDQALPSGQVQLPAATDKAWRSISTWPTRGELATDTALVKDIGDAFDGRPIFVEDVGYTRIAFVISGDRLVVATGHLESVAAEMGRATEGPAADFARDGVLSVGSGSELVVLTTPDQQSAEVSATPTIGRDGTVTRTWSPLPLVDGVGRTSMTPLTRLRLGGHTGGVAFALGNDTQTSEQTCEEPCNTDLPVWLELSTTNEIARMLGIDAATIETETAFRGPVTRDFRTPGLNTTSSDSPRLHIMLSRLAGGQVLRSAVLEDGGEDLQLEIGRPLDASRAAVTPLISFGSGKSAKSPTTVHVVAPSGTAVRAVSDSPALWPSSAIVPLTNQVASFEVPVSPSAFDENYRIEVLDGDRVINEVRATVRTTDDFDGAS